MRASVIQLDQLSVQDDFPAYVAIHSDRLSDNPCVLSPAVMQWSEQILICRVKDCEQFWLAQQQKLCCELEQLFERVLIHHFGSRYIAVFANHPWQCVVYLTYQVHQQSQGIYFLQSPLNRNIFKSLGWEFWFAPQDDLITHFESAGVKRFKAESFRARQAQFKRFIGRTGLAGPFALKQADHHAITRRFEGWLGKVWRWTFDSDSDLLGFPWIALDQPVRPAVSRDLEYPLNQWCYIKLLLSEDLERLCEQFDHDDSEHINRMLWQITLFNYQVIEVELSFRHPYSLHREAPDFKTALYQAWYVYDDLMRKLQLRDRDLDLPESMPFVRWKIEVCERIHLPPMLWDLFGNDETEVNTRNLCDLQNKLSVPIESYRIQANFYRSSRLRLSQLEASPSVAMTTTSGLPVQLTARFFIINSSQQIEAPASGQRLFLERCTSQWWLHESPERQIKDYFLLKDRQGRASWVYRDYDGKWFKQGEYW